MRVTEFETRHAVTIHQVIVAAAFGTYLLERDDVVWRLVKNSTAPVHFERWLFAVATLLVGAAALVCTRFGSRLQPRGRNAEAAGGEDRRRGFGELLYAIGLGSLAPLAGFLILVGGEALRISRLVLAAPAAARPGELTAHRKFAPEFAKWGMFAAMAVFTVTLSDRLAEVLAGIVFTFAIAFNFLSFAANRKSEAR